MSPFGDAENAKVGDVKLPCPTNQSFQVKKQSMLDVLSCLLADNIMTATRALGLGLENRKHKNTSIEYH